jgi:RHS repeat-associated protein
VVGVVTSELVLGTTELVTRVHQPGGFTAESAVDAAGKLVRKTDENGVTHRYVYDALGRLVHVDTPDGGHSLAFDGFGRAARVTRDGIGAITYTYAAGTGLLVRKQRLDAAGAVTDTSDTLYDAIGRPLQVSQTAGHEASNLSFDYDGHLDGATVPGQLGRSTRSRGDGWERSQLFDPLGRAYEQHTTLTGWRDLTSDKTYRPDGSIASDSLTIRDGGGAITFSSTQETVLDGFGRVTALHVDGAVLYTLSYDDEGRLARADFTSGAALAFDYDPVTHERRGHQLQAPDSTGGVQWERDPRGLVAAETYTNATTTTRCDYTYDGRGALLSAAAGAELASYTYTTSGLPDSISDLAGTRSVHHLTSNHVTAGDVAYTWDAAGRVVGKGEWSFDYGANGQLSHASRPGRQLEFVYDDANQRLLKRIDGVPVRADVAGGVLTADHFLELVAVGGVVAGVLDNGKFTALLTDPRGTPFAGPDGTPGLASPYGVRASHLGLAEVIDYARLGWDPDLDVVRMGVRDYDPKLSQFLTPDPLYFEDLEKCQASPLQCSLYGYAGGNPISFVDPTGLGFWSWAGDFAGGVAGGVVDMAGGVYHTVRHPIETAKAVGHMVTHPVQTAKGIAGAAYHAVSSCVGGDGHACGHLTVDIAAVFVGAEVAEVGKIGELGKAGELLQGARAAELAEAAKASKLLKGVEASEAAVTKSATSATKATAKSWQDFIPEAKKRVEATKAKYGDTDAVMMARKADIKQVDRIVKDLGLDKNQRRLLHDEITRQELTIEEIREIAHEISQRGPKGGKSP